MSILVSWFTTSTVYAINSKDDFYIGFIPIVDTDFSKEIMYIGSFGCVEGELTDIQYFMGNDHDSKQKTVYFSKVDKEPRPDVGNITNLSNFCKESVQQNKTNVVKRPLDIATNCWFAEKYFQ